MKIIESASLYLRPSIRKDGVLAAQKPLNANGQFAVTRDGAGGASIGTEIDANGLIVKGRENVLLHSNDFSNAAWSKNLITMSSGEADKDGGTSAWRMTANSTGQYRRLAQTTSATMVATSSIYVKAGTANFVYLVHTSGSYSVGGYQYFDILNGTKGTASTLKTINSTITSEGGGWYRIDLTSEPDAGGQFYLGVADADALPDVTGGNYIYIQDAQLEKGLVATDYIETTTAPVAAGLLGNTPRFDKSSGCDVLIAEPSRTNLLTYSEFFGTGSGWTTSASTITDNAALSPEGNVNAAELNVTGAGGSVYYDFTCSPSTAYTFSFYVKQGTNTQNYLALRDNTAGVFVETDVLYSASSTEWTRVTKTFTTPAGCTSFRVYAQRYSLGGLGTTYLYGAQVEAGSTATSYIPTYGTAANRGADSISKTGINSLLGNSGTLYLQLNPYDVGSSNAVFKKVIGLFKTNGSVAEAIYLEEYLGDWGVWVRKGGITITSTGYKTTQPTKIAVTFGSEGSRVYFDGTQQAFTAVDTSMDMNQISTTSTAGVGIETTIYLAGLYYFPSVLTPAELAALTTI